MSDKTDIRAPLEGGRSGVEMVASPGAVPIGDGYVRPTDAPGFGLEVTREWLERAAV